MDDLLVVGGIYFLLASVAIGAAAWRLAVLRGEGRMWRCAVPFWNTLILGEFLRVDHGIALILALLLFWLPYSAVLILPILAGIYARGTGRPRWWGWALSVFPFSMLGLLILAATARRAVPTS
ncbi:MAG TPA: hypothetical protein VFS30_13855 [Dehalococcoidia bacterium]|nr:hypothetical protein [Dehalococcoidia bacterium]